MGAPQARSPCRAQSAHRACALSGSLSTARARDLPWPSSAWHHAPVPRFLTLADVAEVLSVSAAQAYALVRTGDLRAIKVGGRGQWRVEESELEAYIQRLYAQTAAFVQEHPFGADEVTDAVAAH